MKLSPKLYNLSYWLLCFLLITYSVINFTIITAKAIGISGLQPTGAMQAGGRIIGGSLTVCLVGSVPDPVCAAVCSLPTKVTTANVGIAIVPYGWSTTGVCMPVSTPVSLNSIPTPIISGTSLEGNEILGLFMPTPLTDIPIGVIGIGL